MTEPNPESTYLEVDSLACGYDNETIIHGLSFSLQKGEIGCLLGPSGCGKSTVLRTLAGFLKPRQGSISIAGKCLSSNKTLTPPEKRNLGMVFQDYALFPHLNVRENICFGLKKKPAVERQSILEEMLALTHLEDFVETHPAELSGGQQQRVALARSLAMKPDILLLDEPFSGLDVELRRTLSLNVRDILKQSQTTALLVTHDQEEAFAVADKVGVMQKGRLYQWDIPYNLYHKPQHRFVADFIGRGCFIRGKMLNKNQVETEIGLLSGISQKTIDTGQNVELLVRPDDVLIDDDSSIFATIEDKLFIGTSTVYSLRLESGTKLETLLPSHEDYQLGSKHGLRVDAPHLIVFSSD